MARLAFLLLFHAFLFDGLTAQERPVWALDLDREELRLAAPGGPPHRVVRLPGAPWQARADLRGCCVVISGVRSGFWLVAGGSPRFVATQGTVLDAVPDGRGGAWASLGGGAVGVLVKVDARGRLRESWPLPRPSQHLRQWGPEALLITLRWGPGLTELRRLDAETGSTLASLLLPATPRDLVLDDAGRCWLPAASPGGIPVVDASLSVVALRPVAVVRDVAPVPRGVAVLAGEPAALVFVTAEGETSPVVLPGARSLTSLPDGAVLALDGLGYGWRVEAEGGLVWSGPWKGSLAGSDGGGLEAARWGLADPDPDADGWPTTSELPWGADPGDARAAPLRLELSGARTAGGETPELRVEARRLAGAGYRLALSRGRPLAGGPFGLAPGPLLALSQEPGRLFDRPQGLLDPEGRARVKLLASAELRGMPLWLGGVVCDPQTGSLHLVAPPRRVVLP